MAEQYKGSPTSSENVRATPDRPNLDWLVAGPGKDKVVFHADKRRKDDVAVGWRAHPGYNQ